MAKVTITIQDLEDDGGITIDGQFDPPSDGPDVDTQAQATGRALLVALASSADWDEALINDEPIL